MVVYQLGCFCKADYIGFNIRQLRKRIKEHFPKSVENFSSSEKKVDVPVKVLNASNRLSVAEHMVKDSTCRNSHSLNRFKLIISCSNVFDLIKPEALCTLLRKPVLC